MNPDCLGPTVVQYGTLRPRSVDVLAFVRVAETGSFARAAVRMGLSKPVVSRRVARLEEHLGARLLTRTARGAQPTEIGQTYYARAAAILGDLEAAQEVVHEAVTQVAGPIRLTAPLSFGVGYLAPALADFAKLHPRVELDIEFETAPSISPAAATISRSGSGGSPIRR